MSRNSATSSGHDFTRFLIPEKTGGQPETHGFNAQRRRQQRAFGADYSINVDIPREAPIAKKQCVRLTSKNCNTRRSAPSFNATVSHEATSGEQKSGVTLSHGGDKRTVASEKGVENVHSAAQAVSIRGFPRAAGEQPGVNESNWSQDANSSCRLANEPADPDLEESQTNFQRTSTDCEELKSSVQAHIENSEMKLVNLELQLAHIRSKIIFMNDPFEQDQIEDLHARADEMHVNEVLSRAVMP